MASIRKRESIIFRLKPIVQNGSDPGLEFEINKAGRVYISKLGEPKSYAAYLTPSNKRALIDFLSPKKNKK